MKKLNKVLVLVLAVIMTLAMSASVFAQAVPNGSTQDTNKGQIVVTNAALGETYTIYKLFDATLGKNGEVAYKGTIPQALSTYFEETSTGSGYVKPTDAAWNANKTDMSDGLKAALKTWAEGHATDDNDGTAVSDGTKLYFNNLPFGYYVITTTQGEALVTVDKTAKVANVIDKNSTIPTVVKKVEGQDESTATIGDTVTYTATFTTANFIGEEQVKSYTISDTLPDFLTNVQITELKVIQTKVEADKTTYPDVDLSSSYTAFSGKKILIPWVDDNDKSLYKNGSEIQLTYTAVISPTLNINTANTNTVTLTPNKDKGGDDPFEEPYSDTAVVKTYGAAIKKVDQNNNPLPGAKFAADGLSVAAVDGEPGVYKVTGFDPNSTTLGTEMEVNEQGMLYIIGLASDVTLQVTETQAPDGYNKLTGKTALTPQQLTETIYETSGTRYYDAQGNLLKEEATGSTSKTVEKNYTALNGGAIVIKNEPGVELPGTGGIGTTIFYILGSLLVVGCGIVLISRKRMENNK